MRTAMLSFGVALGLATSIVEAQETARRVKVFILAGQSNMEGKGQMKLAEFQSEAPEFKDFYVVTVYTF